MQQLRSPQFGERKFFLTVDPHLCPPLLQFSDMLIHATISGAGGYKCRDVMPIVGMEVNIPQLSPVPFTFTVVSTTRSLTLAASTQEEKQEWYEVCPLTCGRWGVGWGGVAPSAFVFVCFRLS